MASGVSKATIPTMAGMVGALSGVFASTYLQRKAKREVALLERQHGFRPLNNNFSMWRQPHSIRRIK